MAPEIAPAIHLGEQCSRLPVTHRSPESRLFPNSDSTQRFIEPPVEAVVAEYTLLPSGTDESTRGVVGQLANTERGGCRWAKPSGARGPR